MIFDKRGNKQIPPPPYKVPNLHPHKYYKTDRSAEMNKQESKAPTSQETENDQYS